MLTQSNFTPFNETSRSMLKDRIRGILKELSPRNEKIIRLRFGIGESDDHTLEEIGNQFEVTRERIRQIEAKALQKLRANAKTAKLRTFFEGREGSNFVE